VKIEFFLLNFNGIWNFLPIFLLMIFENCHRVDLRGAKFFHPSLIDKLQNFLQAKIIFFSKFFKIYLCQFSCSFS